MQTKYFQCDSQIPENKKFFSENLQLTTFYVRKRFTTTKMEPKRQQHLTKDNLEMQDGLARSNWKGQSNL
jgi:hypothetical protein